MVESGFQISSYDSCLYFKQTKNSEVIYLLLYVDDMLIAGPSIKSIQVVKEVLKFEFDVKDLGKAQKILGISIERNRSSSILKLCQSSYLQKVISKFSMENAKPASVPLGGHYKLSVDQCPVIE